VIIVDTTDPVRAAVEAARIYYDGRRRGLTVRGTTACYLAHLAIEHGFALLHDDRDFDAIAKVRPLVTLPRGPRRAPAG
jgi:predicted nucleic acid-binding protein